MDRKKFVIRGSSPRWPDGEVEIRYVGTQSELFAHMAALGFSYFDIEYQGEHWPDLGYNFGLASRAQIPSTQDLFPDLKRFE